MNEMKRLKLKYFFPLATFLAVRCFISWDMNSLIALVNGLGGGVAVAWIISDWRD